MQADLHIDPIGWGWVTAMFTLSYCLFEIPTGALGDRIGPRRVLTRVVLWWSAFTSLTGLASNYSLLLITRFCFGAGEAGAFPNASVVVARWFPSTQRASMAGVLLMASQIGGAVAPLFWSCLSMVFLGRSHCARKPSWPCWALPSATCTCTRSSRRGFTPSWSRAGVSAKAAWRFPRCPTWWRRAPTSRGSACLFTNGGITFQQSGVFGVSLDIGRAHAGSMVGLMNTAAQVGGLLSSVAYGYIVDRFGGYDAPFVPMAGLLFLGALLSFRIDASQEVSL